MTHWLRLFYWTVSAIQVFLKTTTFWNSILILSAGEWGLCEVWGSHVSDMTPCSPVVIYQGFRGNYCFHLQDTLDISWEFSLWAQQTRGVTPYSVVDIYKDYKETKLWNLLQDTLRVQNICEYLLDYAVSDSRNLLSWGKGGPYGSIITWGTMLQAGRSRIRLPMRSLDFSVHLILPETLWPWGRLSL
jgi:hypothetical protein